MCKMFKLLIVALIAHVVNCKPYLSSGSNHNPRVFRDNGVRTPVDRIAEEYTIQKHDHSNKHKYKHKHAHQHRYPYP